MLKILMGPNVKILMGQSFGSWTHGHGPMAWAQGLALAAAGGEWGIGVYHDKSVFTMTNWCLPWDAQGS